MATIVFPSGSEFEIVNLSDVDDGIDYSDPVANGAVPLIRIKDREDENLSENFKVKELKANDPNANYARISPDLVQALQKIRNRIGSPISTRNTGSLHGGYRHKRLNSEFNGAPRSQHLTGRAVDCKTDNMSGKELAKIVLEEIGCGIGIGIGGRHIHFDLRGSRASWAYQPFTENEIDEYVRSICG